MTRGEANHGDGLYAALDELRCAEDLHAKKHTNAWRVVMLFVQALRPVDPDAQQETLLRIARNAKTFAGESPGEAVRWVKTIHTRKSIDAVRKESRDLVAKSLDRGRADDEGPSVVETIAAAPLAPSHGALLLFQEELLMRVDAMLLRTVPEDSARRHLRRTWARTSFLRLVHELDSDAIVHELSLPATTSKDLISKWVERGRAVLLETLADWPADSDSVLAAQALEGVVGERRKDAGRARVGRRKRGSGDAEEQK